MLHVVDMICDSASCFSSKRPRKFLDEDAPLVVSLHIDNCLVRRIVVDIGSSSNITYTDTGVS